MGKTKAPRAPATSSVWSSCSGVWLMPSGSLRPKCVWTSNSCSPGTCSRTSANHGWNRETRSMSCIRTMKAVSRALTDSWILGGVQIPNRVVLAPLAGIGNWFVRLQAKRHGAGLVVSEMVSSFAVHYRNERTCTELLRIHPDEHPVSIQLFGHDPAVMASAAERVAQAGADLIDLNMGCPVPKVCKTGAGAALLGDPDRAVALARAAARGSGLPVTVKLRSGQRPGDLSGVEVARRLVYEAGVAGLCIHPRHASQRHNGAPDYEGARAGGGAAGARADLRRPAQCRAGARGVCADRGRGGAAGARIAGESVAV